MKKITLVMLASASMLLAAPGTPMQGQGMKQGMKKQMMSGQKCYKHRHMKKKQMNSPFLIKHGLPHLGKMIMPYMDDPDFALSAEQKTKLALVRSETMEVMMKVKPQVLALRKEIIAAGKTGTPAEALQEKVAKLAVLEAMATMTHLKCIEMTKNILTKDQLLFLLSQKNRKMKQRQNPMQRNKCKKCKKRK